MSSARLLRLQAHFPQGRGPLLRRDLTAEAAFIEIGGVKAPLRRPQRPDLVPRGFVNHFEAHRVVSPEALGHFRWMLQKDLLGQDMFLLGAPGPARMRMAQAFCELTGREVEYVSISRDTTEADLKQRRELTGGSSYFVDSAPVRAALHGRVLILDGIEKAERNVLPTLNNLLENREMHLDDGRFLMSPAAYDALLASGYTTEELERRNLCRVHPDFRVVALGLPVPPYPGHALDPPLRSRFQARMVPPPSFETTLDFMRSAAPDLPADLLRRVATAAESLRMLENQEVGASGSVRANRHLPIFPYWGAQHLARALAAVASKADPTAILARSFPVLEPGYARAFDPAQANSARRLVAEFLGGGGGGGGGGADTADSPQRAPALRTIEPPGQAQFEDGSTLAVPLGSAVRDRAPPQRPPFEYAVSALQDLRHAVLTDLSLGRDVCLSGGRGTGKSHFVESLATDLGMDVEVFVLHRDLTARDLVQRRGVREGDGATEWLDSPLVAAARRGSLAILDGIDRLPPDVANSLQRFVHDRYLDLYDGTRLVPSQHPHSTQAPRSEGPSSSPVVPVHPSFRILALADLPGSGKGTWMTPETSTLFSFHAFPQYTSEAQHRILAARFPALSEETLTQLSSFSDVLGGSAALGATPMSMRQLVRLCRHLATGDSSVSLGAQIENMLLVPFLPGQMQQAMRDAMARAGIRSSPRTATRGSEAPAVALEVDATGESLVVGERIIPRAKPERPELVPNPVFYDNAAHSALMSALVTTHADVGDRALLLIGNQGVGKNRVVDRLLQLLQREREYCQLHRDTTIQSLTVQPMLEDGRLRFVDSPLVRAARHGRVLVVDEADKAPLEVVCLLKSLLEDGQMRLGDGRKLVAGVAAEGRHDGPDVVRVHPDFRMWVLANRPGFPFLGNDFFKECGDVFTVFTVDNPDSASEANVLSEYAPRLAAPSGGAVSELGTGGGRLLLEKLVGVFSRLRELNQEGTLAYPYSIREAVAIAKHLNEYPKDGISDALENVLSFDSYAPHTRSIVASVFQQAGFPVSATLSSLEAPQVVLSEPQPLPPSELHRTLLPLETPREHAVTYSPPAPPARARQWRLPNAVDQPWQIESSRLYRFSEEVGLLHVWDASSNEKRYGLDSDRALHIAATGPRCNDLHVLASSPSELHSFYGVGDGKGNGARRSAVLLGDMWEYRVQDDSPHLFPVTLPQTSPGAQHLAVLYPKAGLLLTLAASSDAPSEGTLFELLLEGGRQEQSQSQGILDGMFGRGGGGRRRDKARQSKRDPEDGLIVSGALAQEGKLLLFSPGGSSVTLLDCSDGSATILGFPTNTLFGSSGIQSISVLSPSRWLLRHTNGETSLWDRRSNVLSAAHPASTHPPSTVVSTKGAWPVALQGCPEDSRIMSGTHSPMEILDPTEGGEGYQVYSTSMPAQRRGTQHLGCHQQGAQEEPIEDVLVSVVEDPGQHVGLEVIRSQDRSVTTVPIASWPRQQARKAGADRKQPPSAVTDITQIGEGGVATLEADGTVRLFQVRPQDLERELEAWRAMYGAVGEEQRAIQQQGIVYSDEHGNSVPRTDASAPKHGKEDEKNEPHVGGNTWAGGTGGSDTAGLGGRGGPYRLDKGHQVHQVSEEDKANVPPEAQEAARRMAQEGLEKKLREIEMGQSEWDTYSSYYGRIAPQVQQLRVVLEASEDKSEERTWMKHQTSGELDDTKLVDGIAGDRTIFKRRGQDEETRHGDKDEPTRLLFAVDVSGSMYRFNGQDGRLERLLESTIMVMEALEGFEHRYEYAIVGHSGDAAQIPFVPFGKPPKNRKERLQILQKMVAHSQFCWSGDHTLEAASASVDAIREIAGEDGRKFVFLLSDANLRRYGIDPQDLGTALTKDPDVKAHFIMLASFSDEARRAHDAMPPGTASVCLDTAELPRLMQSALSVSFDT